MRRRILTGPNHGCRGNVSIYGYPLSNTRLPVEHYNRGDRIRAVANLHLQSRAVAS